MAYYLSKFLTRLAEETKSAKELLVNLIAANFPVERANRLIIVIIIIIIFFIFYFLFLPRIQLYELDRSNSHVIRCDLVTNLVKLSTAPENWKNKCNITSKKDTVFSAHYLGILPFEETAEIQDTH